jgi:ubiquinone/menaquinone biosynthesis C-methylase UbiE
MKKENYETIFRFENENWWYRAKRELLRRILAKTGRKFESALDLGCGVGSNFEVLKSFSKNVIGIDSSNEAIKYCKNRGYDKLMKMDALKMKFKNNSFDLVLCSDVLEHIDDKKAVDEILRVLKPKGIFVFSVPAHNYLWGPTDVISNHRKRYEKADLIELMEDKFEIIKMGYWNFSMFIPNLIFTGMLRIVKRDKKAKNTLEFIPKFLNRAIYKIISVENKFFMNAKLPQGVSIIGICRKK